MMSAGVECYRDAALRHFVDARSLAAVERWDSAGHVMGFAAECSIEHAVKEAAGVGRPSP